VVWWSIAWRYDRLFLTGLVTAIKATLACVEERVIAQGDCFRPVVAIRYSRSVEAFAPGTLHWPLNLMLVWDLSDFAPSDGDGKAGQIQVGCRLIEKMSRRQDGVRKLQLSGDHRTVGPHSAGLPRSRCRDCSGKSNNRSTGVLNRERSHYRPIQRDLGQMFLGTQDSDHTVV
jgi:hypothetical protein